MACCCSSHRGSQSGFDNAEQNEEASRDNPEDFNEINNDQVENSPETLNVVLKSVDSIAVISTNNVENGKPTNNV